MLRFAECTGMRAVRLDIATPDKDVQHLFLFNGLLTFYVYAILIGRLVTLLLQADFQTRRQRLNNPALSYFHKSEFVLRLLAFALRALFKRYDEREPYFGKSSRCDEASSRTLAA